MAKNSGTFIEDRESDNSAEMAELLGIETVDAAAEWRGHADVDHRMAAMFGYSSAEIAERIAPGFGL